jgi:hypothetical protein
MDSQNTTQSTEIKETQLGTNILTNFIFPQDELVVTACYKRMISKDYLRICRTTNDARRPISCFHSSSTILTAPFTFTFTIVGVGRGRDSDPDDVLGHL